MSSLCAPRVRKRDLRAGINFPDAFVLDPVVAAQAVRGAERLVTLAAGVLLHLLHHEERERERERESRERAQAENAFKKLRTLS